jgi:tetratricopeptide (TPR) repeat protein
MNNQAQPQPLKLVFRGRLEFGSQRTYDMVLKHWQTRIENYFKTDILFKAEQVFSADDYALTVPQQTLMSSEKHWRNTTALLREVAQFALAGNVGAWWVQNGKVLDEHIIEPKSDKVAVSEYLRGRDLVQQGGMEQATEALTNAIEKYERHAAAYERRGYVNYKLKNFNDALYDFSKSIGINPYNPEAYYGRGKVRMLKNEWEGAIQDFDQTIKGALAVQPIHWLARLRKSDCLYHAKRPAEAIPELKAYLQRNFSENDPNLRFRPKAEFLLAECERLVKG